MAQLRIKLMKWKIEGKYLFCGHKDEKYKRTQKKEWSINIKVPISNDFLKSTTGKTEERNNIRKYL